MTGQVVSRIHSSPFPQDPYAADPQGTLATGSEEVEGAPSQADSDRAVSGDDSGGRPGLGPAQSPDRAVALGRPPVVIPTQEDLPSQVARRDEVREEVGPAVADADEPGAVRGQSDGPDGVSPDARFAGRLRPPRRRPGPDRLMGQAEAFPARQDRQATVGQEEPVP